MSFHSSDLVIFALVFAWEPMWSWEFVALKIMEIFYYFFCDLVIKLEIQNPKQLHKDKHLTKNALPVCPSPAYI